MKIEIYDRVYITIKEGNYFWNEYFSTPECVYISFIYDKYDCHTNGKNNKVKIIIDKPTKPCQTCTSNNHVAFTKLSGYNLFKRKRLHTYEIALSSHLKVFGVSCGQTDKLRTIQTDR